MEQSLCGAKPPLGPEELGARMGKAGEMVTETLDYDGGRAVTVYVPPEPVDLVVFAADGGWHLPRLVEAMERSDAPSTMVVGVHGKDDDDGRLREYVTVVDPERFAAHEEFFLDDAGRWVQKSFGVDLQPTRTAVWGASLGGELALAMGIRHPDVYGAIFCASPGAGYRPMNPLPTLIPSTYLVAGQQEEFFLENAQRWADALRDAEARVNMTVREGGHGDPFWFAEFPLMVNWAFPD
jgi:enterochelin esterase-like enzyme